MILLEDYLKLDYPLTIRKLIDEEGSGWLVSFPDLPGIIGTGDSKMRLMMPWKQKQAG